jgi:hypothetical protein
LFVTVIATMLLGVGQPLPKQQQTAQYQAYAQTIPAENGSTPQVEGNRTGGEPKGVWERAFGPEYWSSWALVIVSLSGIGAALRTLKTIKRQTDAAKVSADAAKLSAEALIIGNRPWILLGKETTVPISPPQDWKFNVFLKNYGKTPAKIIWLRVEVCLGTGDASPPDDSVYNKPAYSHPFMLPPEEALPWQMRLPEPWASHDVLEGNKYLWLCGFVVYSDTIEREGIPPYETAFCLVYQRGSGISKPAWKRAGPKEYNRTS